MNMTSWRQWCGQVTTGGGFAALSVAVAGLLTHTMSPEQVVPAVAGAVIALIWPENVRLSTVAQGVARQAVAAEPMAAAAIEQLVAAYQAGARHGATVSVPAAAAPVAATVASATPV